MRQHTQAREMITVPDNAIQIDVFTHNTATGKLEKTRVFTEAAEPEAPRQATRAAPSRPATRASKPAPVNVAGKDDHWQIEVNADEETWVDILLEQSHQRPLAIIY